MNISQNMKNITFVMVTLSYMKPINRQTVKPAAPKSQRYVHKYI